MNNFETEAHLLLSYLWDVVCGNGHAKARSTVSDRWVIDDWSKEGFDTKQMVRHLRRQGLLAVNRYGEKKYRITILTRMEIPSGWVKFNQ